MTYMRSGARQRQILECAKRVFAERGFHAASVSHICAAAGIGRGTLYLYFPNKKAVFTAIVKECLDRVQALVGRRGAPMPAPESLRRGAVIEWSAGRLRRVFEAAFEDERTLRILLREAVGLDASIEALLGEIDDTLIGLVEADLRDAQAAGIARADLDPRDTATLMVGGVEKLALAALRSERAIDIGRLALEASRLHLIGVLSDRVRD
ncbi:MAG TPA: helix-turn-helix domain-containing protein [Kofleriaceae bacterium]|nr:helix-turn-helix domain-containing protein [Kofleriaceae bacterium]